MVAARRPHDGAGLPLQRSGGRCRAAGCLGGGARRAATRAATGRSDTGDRRSRGVRRDGAAVDPACPPARARLPALRPARRDVAAFHLGGAIPSRRTTVLLRHRAHLVRRRVGRGVSRKCAGAVAPLARRRAGRRCHRLRDTRRARDPAALHLLRVQAPAIHPAGARAARPARGDRRGGGARTAGRGGAHARRRHHRRGRADGGHRAAGLHRGAQRSRPPHPGGRRDGRPRPARVGSRHRTGGPAAGSGVRVRGAAEPPAGHPAPRAARRAGRGPVVARPRRADPVRRQGRVRHGVPHEPAVLPPPSRGPAESRRTGAHQQLRRGDAGPLHGWHLSPTARAPERPDHRRPPGAGAGHAMAARGAPAADGPGPGAAVRRPSQHAPAAGGLATMCGIYGMVGTLAPPSDAVLARMAERLAHRGPDADGQIVAGRAGLGCRRLAIIDLPGGTQPLANENGDVYAVCNGEIYNHVRLRRELTARGHRFRTGSDAEVIPHLYEEQGPDFVHALDGMFAVAVWDARRHRLVLARDRLGEKPLYHATTAAGLWFASEPKSLRAVDVGTEPDWAAIGYYLRSGSIPGVASAWMGVASLPPGGRLVLEGERVQLDRYWKVAPLLAAPALDLSLDTAAQRLRAALERSVTASLTSDVPVGVFLSGGLDSTAITALARPHVDELATFALGFDVPGFDERDHAALAARKLRTRHRTLTIDPSLFLEGVQALAPFLDEPLADPALVPTYLLARFARTEVKVVLIGEGGDELFAGYPTYPGGALATAFQRLPVPVRRVLAAAAPVLGAPRGNTTARWMLRRFLEAADRPEAERHREWTGCMSSARLAQVATPGGPLGSPVGPADEPWTDDGPPGRTTIDRLLALDLTGLLPDTLLRKADRATMAASLEGRAPFLDHHVVELACRLPVALKVRGLVTKRVLRRAVADVVPPPIRRRVKRGLTVPLAAWIAGPLEPFVRSTLDRLDPAVIRPDAVRTLLDEHVEQRRDNRRELWALVMLQLWLDQR